MKFGVKNELINYETIHFCESLDILSAAKLSDIIQNSKQICAHTNIHTNPKLKAHNSR